MFLGGQGLLTMLLMMDGREESGDVVMVMGKVLVLVGIPLLDSHDCLAGPFYSIWPHLLCCAVCAVQSPPKCPSSSSREGDPSGSPVHARIPDPAKLVRLPQKDVSPFAMSTPLNLLAPPKSVHTPTSAWIRPWGRIVCPPPRWGDHEESWKIENSPVAHCNPLC